MILAGDLGGTNCRLAVFDMDLSVVTQKIYKCRDYDSFEAIVEHFITNCEYSLKAACFGLPGPVKQGKCKLTNLPWPEIDATKLVEVSGGLPVKLLNDVEANAYGLKTLQEDELVTLNEGDPIPGGNCAIVSPGTGLGEAALIEVEGRSHAIASEGGHADFAPLNELQMDLVKYVQQKYRRVSYEIMLGGPGLVWMYDFLLDRSNTTTPEWLAQEMTQGDKAAAISNAALNNKCPICVQALDMFVSILGSEAANAAVKFLATGGVYIGGGIPPRILNKLQEPLFMENFLNKDKMVNFLKGIPIYVILNDKAALQGAAWYGKRIISSPLISSLETKNPGKD
ncbi:glucokinase [Oscillatoria salina]|uniref:glucokinase n=1 Tax=Oscillatoria salina TaxID=331517 RepID=UPI0013BE0699|nr:glucokinase [Oscillatoria salina]MBZ8179719.1 glucokinase [Oscillatoria salina IIICB1]NET87179.1 glucokinase [Kamptonema sp. SIO1D9]